MPLHKQNNRDSKYVCYPNKCSSNGPPCYYDGIGPKAPPGPDKDYNPHSPDTQSGQWYIGFAQGQAKAGNWFGGPGKPPNGCCDTNAGLRTQKKR